MASLTVSIPVNKSSESIRRTAKMSSHEIQNMSMQDVALHGSTNDFDFLVVSDGHGSGVRKHILRDLFNSLDWAAILQNENWYKKDVNAEGKYISPLFAKLHSNIGSPPAPNAACQGCTLSVVLIYPDHFECFTIGDSTIKIWEKTEEDTWYTRFVSTDHDINFLEDVERLRARNKADAMFCRSHWQDRSIVLNNGIRTKGVHRLKALSDTKITMEPSAYFYFDDGSLLNMTRSLGHYPTATVLYNAKNEGHALSCAEHSLTKVVIERKPDVKYAVIAATDGVWDVAPATTDMDQKFIKYIVENDTAAAETICTIIKQSWSQDWDYWYENVFRGKTRLPDSNRDDIACSVAYC